MQATVVPADEVDWREALFALDLLTSPEEERFDRMTRLACALFSVPICLIRLVDGERQWFKSGPGLDAPESARDI